MAAAGSRQPGSRVDRKGSELSGSDTGAWRSLAGHLGLERNVVAASSAVLLLSLGEEIWKKFLPKYLESLGAGALAIGAFGTAKDFLDAVYQYPGGYLADRIGRRRALLLFVGLASCGYLIYLIAPSWPFLFIGLAFVMAWSSMASPAIFAVIGDALPKARRTMGFTVQSLLKRIPMALAPLAGGVLIVRYGVEAGVRAGILATLIMAAGTAVIVSRISVTAMVGTGVNARGVWRSFHTGLKRLLLSDIIIRTCEGTAEVFVILYATNIIGVSASQFGLLVAIQMTTAMLVYLPAARVADRIGRKPFVTATFSSFALYPLLVVFASSFPWLILAFVVGGLREIGEPARKAMIVDSAEPHLRGRTVGLYYLIRSLAITPAAAVGGLLWEVSPSTPFIAAGITGVVGTLVFVAIVEERYAA